MSAPEIATDESGWPLTKKDRQWNQWQLFVVLLVTAAATWCYIIGEYVGYYLNLKMGFPGGKHRYRTIIPCHLSYPSSSEST